MLSRSLMSASLLHEEYVNFHPEISKLFGSFHKRASIVHTCFHPNLHIIKQIHPFHPISTSLGHQNYKELANKSKHGRQCNHWHHFVNKTHAHVATHIAISLYHYTSPTYQSAKLPPQKQEKQIQYMYSIFLIGYASIIPYQSSI